MLLVHHMLGHFKMDLKAKAEQYFETFSSKDLNGLASMFADNIMLRDWTGDATGKEKVLTANQDIFDAVDTIQVKPLTLYQAEASLEDNTVIAEIEIEVNGDEKLMVVDVIDYDDNGLITSIRAYKG
jgi:ketosteroid isomerase-like protein